MRCSVLIAFVCLHFFFIASAQETGKVSGLVKASGEKASEAASATVSLLRAKDSAVLKLSATHKDGSFTFEPVAHGKYLVSATAVGHRKAFSAPFEITPEKGTIHLPAIQLVPAPRSMTGVTVTAQRPLVEQKVDRTLVNVEASVTNVGATALEVLEKAPGVVVDKDGNISLKGKEGVLILVDGRPTQLGGADLANLLRNMSANQMDQVEIMTNPPARYDAAGNAGIINIKTKKNITAGYNGSFTLGYTQGRYPKTNEGFNLALREGKVAAFANLSHNYQKNFETLGIQRNLRNEDTYVLENYFDQQNDKIKEGSSYNAKVGLDYFASKKNTFGIVLNGYYNPTTSVNRNETYISTSAKELESVTRATVDQDATWKNFSTNLNFRRVFNAAGRELTADVDYIAYDSRNEQYMINAYYDAQGDPLRKADTLLGALPQTIKIYSGRADYLHPLKKGAKLEAGVKTTVVRTDNNAAYDSIQYGSTVRDHNRSNHFVYEENINAAYLNLSAPLSKKLSAQFGLRLENTLSKGYQLTTGEAFDRPYTQLFPTAYLLYKANEKNSFGANYGRRLRRPNYESMNPFIRFLDRYTYTQGNPELRPQFSHNIELSHNFHNKITTTLNYSATNDIIQNVLQQKGQEAYMRPENIAAQRQYGIAVSVNTPVTKWWTNNFYVNAFTNTFKGVVNTTPITISATSLALNGSQQFKLSKTATAELSGVYRTGGLQGVVRMRSMGMLSAGYSQQVLKSMGTLRLTVRDILHTQQANATTRYSNVDASFQEARDSRVVSLGFTYRFNKGKAVGQRKRTTGSVNEEQQRVGID